MRLFTGRTDPRRRSFAPGPRLLVHLGLALLLASTASCCRKFYRKSADEEVSAVLAEKDKYPAWQIEQWHVYPDPRARFADPTNPDRPPVPPDDPAARDLAPNPQKPPHKAGVAYFEGTAYLDLLAAWDAENRVRQQEAAKAQEKPADGPAPPKDKGPAPPTGGGLTPGPADRAYQQAAADPRGYLITVEQAVELGLINSREYQSRREDLYLLSLPVTLQRFAFAAQWFATEEAVREWFGRQAPEGQQNRWVTRTNVGFNKLFPTGALLLLQFANQTVIDLTGNAAKHTVSESTLTLDFLQPLLRGGGKAVTLEPLTLVERQLLYGIRDYARFRKLFYVALAGGGDLGRGATQVAGRGALSTIPGFTAPVQGFLPILLISAQLNNERQNAAELAKLLVQFRDFREVGLVTQLQVDQVEQNLLNSRNNVLSLELNYRDALDRFKLQLGIPPPIELQLEPAPLQPLSQQFRRYEAVIQQFNTARAAVTALETNEQAVGALSGWLAVNPLFPTPIGVAAATRLNAAELAPGLFHGQLRARVNQGLTATELLRGTATQARLLKSLPAWQQLSQEELEKKLRALGEEQKGLLVEKVQRETEGGTLPEAQQRRLDEIEFEIRLGQLERFLRVYETRPWVKVPLGEGRFREHATLFQEVLIRFFYLLSEARRERLDQLTRSWPEPPAARLGDVDLLDVDLSEAQAAVAQAALINRFDLMNARAQLVDFWRQIAVTANALLGVLNVRYRLETFSPFGEAQPFDFGGSRFRHRLFFNGELPLVRKLERNDYRAALIAFQRARRDLMAFEDNTMIDVREEIRQLRQLAESYTIQKRLVELAYLQVENSQEEFNAPPPPTAAGGARVFDTGSAGTAAALTQQRLNAQASLLRAQNQLYSTWINYQITRLFLYRDLELMPLDFRGVWTDELANLSGTGPDGRAPATERPAPDRQRPEQLPAPRPVPDGGRP